MILISSDLIDPNLSVEVTTKHERPNLQSYYDLHQCYSEKDVYSEKEKIENLSERELGRRVLKVVKRGHHGVVESPSISFNVIGFPHSVMVQARTHRVGVTFNVTSMRYTGERMIKLAETYIKNSGTQTVKECLSYAPRYMKLSSGIKQEIKELFYIRPENYYLDRNNNKYKQSGTDIDIQLATSLYSSLYYYELVKIKGFAPEHARDFLTQNFRQNFTVSFNPRSLMHFLDLRSPADAQLEIRILAQKLYEHFKIWMPELAEWYFEKRYGKNKLAP